MKDTTDNRADRAFAGFTDPVGLEPDGTVSVGGSREEDAIERVCMVIAEHCAGMHVPLVWMLTRPSYDEHRRKADKLRAAVRAAMPAPPVAQEPSLEEVLGAEWHVVSLLSNRIATGEVLWFATVKSRTGRVWTDSASGPTVTAAIRDAVRNATEESAS